MSADYGGTEIRGAMDAVFRSRNPAGSTAVFVLTDGDVSAVSTLNSNCVFIDHRSLIMTVQSLTLRPLFATRTRQDLTAIFAFFVSESAMECRAPCVKA
jgi:sulfur relay (sulfurtransferase) DsrF/TusC family protein